MRGKMTDFFPTLPYFCKYGRVGKKSVMRKWYKDITGILQKCMKKEIDESVRPVLEMEDSEI